MIDKAEFVSPDYHKTNGFGREYVESQIDGSTPELGLDDLREELTDMEYMLEKGLSDNMISPWLRNTLAHVAAGGIAAALTHMSEGVYDVNDATFENVLQAHNYSLAERSREMKPEFDKNVDDFMARVKELVNNGTLPDVVADRLSLLQDVRFAVSDGYADGGALGSCERGFKNEAMVDIMVSFDVIRDNEVFKQTVVHELVHALGNGARDSLKNLLSSALPDKRARYDIMIPLEEALTEHIAQVILGERDMENAKIEESEQSYLTERGFLAALKVSSEGEFSIRSLVDEYFGVTSANNSANGLSAVLNSEGAPVLTNFFTLQDYDQQDRHFA
jgi:hypothetical protein